MSFFKKIGHSIAHIGRKTGSGISHTFKKAGKNIARGLGSLAGGVGGAEIGGAVAGLLGPEAVPVGMLIGGLAGKELGKEGAGVAYKSLEKQRPQGKPAVHIAGSFQGPGGKTGMRGHMSIPDSKYFRGPVRVGENGGGQRQTNPIEKARPPEKKMDLFI
jgi:hypothetical protein